MKRQERSVHELPSFSRYLNKVFDFRTAAAAVTDARVEPEIPPSAVFLAAFHGFVFRLRSFQQLEAEISHPAFQNWIGAPRAFGDDVLRYSLCGFSLSPLERMLVNVNRTLKRNKAFDDGRVQGRIVAAVDGIEVLSSYSRCCDACLERRVSLRQGGVKVERLQYYHRAVACQIVSSPVKTVLAVEWLQPGETEDAATLRLLNQLPEVYGSRFFDILLLDALYAQAPVLQCAEKHGWDLVISLKRNRPELYASAVRLFAHRPADLEFTETMRGKTYQGKIWDTPGLPFSAADSPLVRVVRSEEKLTQNHYRRGEIQAETTDHEWMWITTLDTQAFPPKVVRDLGHERWKQENNGWNDLTQNWALKHGFLHACRHRPRATTTENRPPQSADGAAATEDSNAAPERVDNHDQLIPNQGLSAVTLILMLAFNLCAAFIHGHSKLVRLYHLSGIEVSRQLRVSVSKLPPRIRAPDSPAPQTSTI
jgi:Transposase DDE domain